ncbi:MAG: hypothetical protein VYC34_05700 [Planctomycetota bacterium]|nr:hypothetical protein [Planctomycetota bacterium]
MTTLPAEIRIEQTSDGVRYVLPARRGKAVKVGAIFTSAFGLVFLGITVFAILPRATQAFQGGGIAGIWAGLFMSMFVVVFGGVGLLFVAMTAHMLFGRTEVEVDVREITLTERLGPLRKSWSKPVGELSALRVRLGGMKSNGKVVENSSMAKTATLEAKFGEDEALGIAMGYPRELVEALAAEISKRAAVTAPGRIFSADPVEVEVVEAFSGDVEAPDPRVSKPEGTDITLEQTADGISISVPPLGKTGAKGIRGFAVIWNGLMALFTIGAIWGGVNAAMGKAQGPNSAWSSVGSTVGVIAVFALFWGVGIFMWRQARCMARRRAVIDVVGDTLLINRESGRKVRSDQWSKDRIESIAIGPSGVEVNEEPVMELQIKHTDPESGKTKKRGFLSQRKDEEIRWIAWELRNALGL